MPLKTGFSRYCSRGHVHWVGVHRDRDGLVPETDLLAPWDGRCRLVKAGYDRGMFVAVADEDVPPDMRRHLITDRARAVHGKGKPRWWPARRDRCCDHFSRRRFGDVTYVTEYDSPAGPSGCPHGLDVHCHFDPTHLLRDCKTSFSWGFLYLDNFDEVKYLTGGRPRLCASVSACEILGLPRIPGKQLSGA